ncbi:MAG: twin-arginine translocase TatA/TatE family subunit [Faecalibacterium prausnitzii]
MVLGTRGHRGHRAFVFIGPDQLPVYAKKLGKMLRELKKYTGAASEEIQKNVVEPLNEIQAPSRKPLPPDRHQEGHRRQHEGCHQELYQHRQDQQGRSQAKAEEVEEVTELEDTVEELAPEEPVKAGATPAAEPVKAEERAPRRGDPLPRKRPEKPHLPKRRA